MKRTRGLWVSIIAIGVLMAVSISPSRNRLRPLLGLDLQGGVSVILSAPAGTDTDTMNTALDNIRNRVDAFGVGEPDITLSGNTIEIQIPGLRQQDPAAHGRPVLHRRRKGATYGCADRRRRRPRRSPGSDVLPGHEGVRRSRATRSSRATARRRRPTREEADDRRPEAGEPSASAAASASASPTATRGSRSRPGPYCLTDFNKTELQCYPDYATAQAAYKSMTTKVTETQWCIQAPDHVPSATPTPSASPSKKAKASASAVSEPRASKDPGTAYQSLDQAGSSTLPVCEYDSKSAAEDALAGWSTQHDDAVLRGELPERRSRLLHDAGGRPGTAARDRPAAAARVDRQDRSPRGARRPSRSSRRATRGTKRSTSPVQTPEEQDSKACQNGAQDANDVWYPDQQGNAVHLGPVVITGRTSRKRRRP